MITINEPKTWQELQSKTSEILLECGMDVEIEKKTSSVRGNIVIDVYAKESIQSRQNLILIECKYWNTPIPQTIIHAFRTVVADIGGNTGYIISKKGFQSGSYSAIEYSNIKLLTWHEFLLLFEEQWYKNYFCEYIENKFDSLISYSEPLVPNWALKLEGNDVEKMKQLRFKYEGLGWLLLSMERYHRMLGDEERVKLPLIQNRNIRNIPDEILEIQGYKELIPILHKYCDPAIQEFRELKKKTL